MKDMANEVRIWKSYEYKDEELGITKPSEIGYNHNLTKALSQDGTIKVKLEEDIIIHRLSKEIYTNWKDGIRELLSNEFRACRISIRDFNADSRVLIELDYDKGSLWIKGLDSLGITSQVFLEVLRVLGRTNNFDAMETGLFGMGFLSFMTLSDYCIIRTYARESKERYAVICKEAQSFELLPEPTDLETYGTEVGIGFNNSEIKFKDLLYQIYRFCRLQDIDTTVRYTLSGRTQEFIIPRISLQKIYRNKIEEVYCQEYDYDSHRSVKRCWSDEHLAQKHGFTVHYEDEDLELYAFIEKGSAYSRSLEAFLNGMPISVSTSSWDSSISHGFTVLSLNIKNERTYKPMPNREVLSDEAKNLLSDKVKDLYINETVNILLNPEARQYLTRREESDLLDRLHELEPNFLDKIPEALRARYLRLNTVFRIYANRSRRLKEMIGSRVVAVRKFKRDIVKELRHNCDYVIEVSDFEAFSWLSDFGVQFSYLTEAKRDRREIERTVILHTNHVASIGYSDDQKLNKTTSSIELLPDDSRFMESLRSEPIYLVKKDLSKFFSIFYVDETSIQLGVLTGPQFKWLKRDADLSSFCLPDKIERELKDKKFPTTKGPMSLRELLNETSLALILFDSKVIEGLAKDRTRLNIATDLKTKTLVGYPDGPISLFKLALMLTYQNKAFDFRYNIEHFNACSRNSEYNRRMEHKLFEVQIVYPHLFPLMRYLLEEVRITHPTEFEESFNKALWACKND